MNSQSSESSTANPTNSRQARKPDPRWTQLAGKMDAGVTVTVTVVEVAKDRDGRVCGLHTKLDGLRAFLPGSRIPRGQDAENLVGKTLEVKLIECDQNDRGGKLVVSRVAVVQSDRAKFVESLVVGTEVTGTVVSVRENLGYFVNIGALDALLHVSQTPLENGAPKEFAVGETLTARISQVNLAESKVALSMRAPRSEYNRSGNESRPQAQKTTPTAQVAAVKSPPAIKPASVPAVRKAHRPSSKSITAAKPSRSSITIYTSFADLLAATANKVSE
jgi:ribosomal protein S1